MFNRMGVLIVLILFFLSGCGTGQVSKEMTDSKAAPEKNMKTTALSTQNLSMAQTNIKDTVGEAFLTVKLENGMTYTWDKGADRNGLQEKMDDMLSALTVTKISEKKRPSHYIALLFQNISVIVPYGTKNPERHLLVENDAGTYQGQCPSEKLQPLIDWLKTHQVDIGQ